MFVPKIYPDSREVVLIEFVLSELDEKGGLTHS